jgi:thioredoxin 1
MAVEANTENYDEVVIKSGIPTLVDFWGPKCVRCLELMPCIDDISRKNEGRLKVVKVEAPQSRRLCLNLRLLSLPAFIFYRDGKEISRLVGDGVTENQIRDAVHNILSD